MKILASTLFAAAFAGVAFASPPRKTPMGDLKALWQASPFTSKPQLQEASPPVSPFQDWALGGVSQISGGYMVTLINVKNEGESQIIRPDRVEIYTPQNASTPMKVHRAGEDDRDFSVVRVDVGNSDWKETRVILSSAGRTGSVSYRLDQMIPKAATSQMPQPPGISASENVKPPRHPVVRPGASPAAGR